MVEDELPSVGDICDEVRSSVKAARAVLDARQQIQSDARDASIRIRSRTVSARRDDRPLWQFIPLFLDDYQHIRTIAKTAYLPVVAAADQRELDRLTTEVAKATEDLRAVTGFGRLLLFGGTRDKANRAEKFLSDYYQQYRVAGLNHVIERAAPREDQRVARLTTTDVLSDWVGFKRQLRDRGQTAALEASKTFAILPNATAVIRRAAADESRLRESAVDAGNNVRRMETDRLLADMSVERLREVTRNKIRVGALTRHGITNVLAVLTNDGVLEYLDGIGETSATYIRAAARTLRQNTFDEMPMRIDVKNRTREHTEFLRRLRAWDAARRASVSSAEMTIVDELGPIAAAIDKTVTHAIVIPTVLSTVEDFRDAVQIVARAARGVADARDAATSGDPWDDFLRRPADYFALLAELGFITEDAEKTHGDLPVEIIQAVREFELKGDNILASLRGYQSFAARFALVQRKVIIGDEMGLGKTVEAIAVLAHLRSKGDHQFLVICPAAVVTNWVREVGSKSKLEAHRLHGPDRQWAARNWQRRGGVAVSTFETLPWLMGNVVLPTLGCVVVDEAHYIKNPDARRTQRTAQLVDGCERAIFLTGTPLENRLDEFRSLVGYLRPDLVVNANEFSPKKFRRQVAPAYLRRNQEDVLTELPELVEVEEWVGMSAEDAAAYRVAVAERNFMAMRQACMKQGLKSTKMQRLIEIVSEAEANGRRVIVFSHFLDVLNDVVHQLPGRVAGLLTGSVPASKRQAMVDEFSSADKGAVLVAQIVAGGVGLNIQAASVVVICEPQLKPTTEWQAIARAHRMGQLDSVQVHRLLSDEGVDQRIRQILIRKEQLFDRFARESDVADGAPEAFDITEAALAREVIATERERLFGQGAADLRTDSVAPEEEPSEPSHPERVSAPISSAPSFEAGSHPSRREAGCTGPAVRRRDESATTQLKAYQVFGERVSVPSPTSPREIIDNVVRIVAIEGPVTGWRIHQVYAQCSPVQQWRDESSSLLNRAISAAERQGLIVAENPLGHKGNKPRTFKLPQQSSEVARTLGPRSISVVPPVEVLQYCRLVSGGQQLTADGVVQRVTDLLDCRRSAEDVRSIVLATLRLGSGG